MTKQELSTRSVLFVICVCSRRELDGGRVCWVCIGGLDVVVPADEGEGYIRFCCVVFVCVAVWYERGWLVGICVVVHGVVMFCDGAVLICDGAVGLKVGRIGW